MFIFNRPFRAVGAGLGVALLVVCLDRVSQLPAAAAPAAAAPATASAKTQRSACAMPGACGIVRAGS